MLVVTIQDIPGKRVMSTLGLVSGSTVRTRNLGRDFMAGLRNLVGGEVAEYTKLMAQAREEALRRMTEKAEAMGANAVVGLRFTTAMIMSGASEIAAYGTAVVLE